MKAILEFNLPEDNLEYLQAVKANDMANALWQITNNLKKQCIRKAEDNNQKFDGFDITDGVDIVFEKIYEILESYNINTDELIE